MHFSATNAYELRVHQPYFIAVDFNRDRAQRFTTTRPGYTQTIGDFETRAMRRTYQQAVVEQEFPGRPVQPLSCVRTNILIRKNALTLTQQQDRIAQLQHVFDRNSAAIGNINAATQRLNVFHGLQPLALVRIPG